MKKTTFLLICNLLLSNILLGQTYSVNISTPGMEGAIYSSENWISKTPYIGKIDIERVGRLYVAGENGLFHEISEDELKSDKNLIFSQPNDSQFTFPNLNFKGIDSENAAISFISINGVSSTTGFKKEEYNDVCNRFIESYVSLAKTDEGSLELVGTYINGDSRFKQNSQFNKHFSAFSKIRWKLIDKQSQETLFEEEITGGYYIGKINRTKVAKMFEDQNYAAKKAVLSSLKELFSNKEFLKATEKVMDPSEMKFKDVLSITRSEDFAASIDESISATVTIKTTKGFGSGFIISSDGYILTNSHVVDEVENYIVKFSSGMSVQAILVRKNVKMDVAILKIPLQGLPALELSTTKKLSVGDEIFAIGTPEDIKLGQSITKGIVSGLRDTERNLIQTDVGINRGNSGGPMLDSTYQVVGIISAKLVGLGTEGVGFAIPIEEALEALNIEIQE